MTSAASNLLAALVPTPAGPSDFLTGFVEAAGEPAAAPLADGGQTVPAWIDALGDCLDQELARGTHLTGTLQPIPPAEQPTDSLPRQSSGRSPNRRKDGGEDGVEGPALPAPVLAACPVELPKRLEVPRLNNGLLASASLGAEPAEDAVLAPATAAPARTPLPPPVRPEVSAQPAATLNNRAWAWPPADLRPSPLMAPTALPADRSAVEPSPRSEVKATAFPVDAQEGKDAGPARPVATTRLEDCRPEILPAPADLLTAGEPPIAASHPDREDGEGERDSRTRIVAREMPATQESGVELPRVHKAWIADEAGSQAVRTQGRQPALAGPASAASRQPPFLAGPRIHAESSAPAASEWAFAARIVAPGRPEGGAAPRLSGEDSGEPRQAFSRASISTTNSSPEGLPPAAAAWKSGGAFRPPAPENATTTSAEIASFSSPGPKPGARVPSEKVTPANVPPPGHTAPQRVKMEGPATSSSIALPAFELAPGGGHGHAE